MISKQFFYLFIFSVKLLIKKEIAEIFKGPNYSLILTVYGELFAWGEFSCPEEGANLFSFKNPTELEKNLKFKHISLGNNHILAITQEDEVKYYYILKNSKFSFERFSD